MQMELVPVGRDEKAILRNLLEKYDYEFSQYDLRDVNALGLYDYDYLDHYWTEENRWAFFIKVDGQLAGFVMVNNHADVPDEPCDHAIAEFFVMHKYRRSGVGRFAAFQMFDRFHGHWQIGYHPKNTPACKFWRHVVADYTGGDYRLVEKHPATHYHDGLSGDVLFFKS